MPGYVGGLRRIVYDARVAQSHARLLVAARWSGRSRGAHDLIVAVTAVASDRRAGRFRRTPRRRAASTPLRRCYTS